MCASSNRSASDLLDRKEEPTLSICICTMDRPEILKRCLESIHSGTKLPECIVVSDDSRDTRTTEALCGSFPRVRFTLGPRRGLCANRNHAIRSTASEYISLLDDDAVVSENFVARALDLVKKTNGKKIIVTGDIIEGDLRMKPQNASFFGFFTEEPGARNETIHLNCNIFPRKAFQEVEFDEDIAYGYEDVDLCSHLIALDYQIRYEPDLINRHLPPPRVLPESLVRQLQSEKARFYTSVKRYFLWERNPAKGIAYLLLAPIHRAMHDLKVRNLQDLKYCIPDIVLALRGLIRDRPKQEKLLN